MPQEDWRCVAKALWVGSLGRDEQEPRKRDAELTDRVSARDTQTRIKARWAEAERSITARRTVAGMSFSIQLAPPLTEQRIIKPLAWGKR